MGILDALFGKRVPKTDIKQRFELVGRVGHGTMSEFWRAHDRTSGRTLGVKILDREQTKKFEARFPGLNKPTEGEIALTLQHPHVVKTIEHGITTDGRQFLVMEFIEGALLAELIKNRDDQLRENRLRYMIELGEAISHIHEKNYIYRDLCPRNVMISDESGVKLIDFGLVVPNTAEFRRPGNRTGTANYMAPELMRRRPTDQRIDLFSYGVTCFEICSGRLPWDRAKAREAVLQHAGPPMDLREAAPDIEPDVAKVIMRGVEVDRDRRWQSAREMTAALRQATGVGEGETG